VFSYYPKLRRALGPHGGEVFAVSVSSQEASLWDSAFADDHCVLLAPREDNPRIAAEALVAWLRDERVDVLFPVNSSIAHNAIPQLSEPVIRQGRLAGCMIWRR
jgi:hypothetical protein